MVCYQRIICGNILCLIENFRIACDKRLVKTKLIHHIIHNDITATNLQLKLMKLICNLQNRILQTEIRSLIIVLAVLINRINRIRLDVVNLCSSIRQFDLLPIDNLSNLRKNDRKIIIQHRIQKISRFNVFDIPIHDRLMENCFRIREEFIDCIVQILNGAHIIAVIAHLTNKHCRQICTQAHVSTLEIECKILHGIFCLIVKTTGRNDLVQRFNGSLHIIPGLTENGDGTSCKSIQEINIGRERPNKRNHVIHQEFRIDLYHSRRIQLHQITSIIDYKRS